MHYFCVFECVLGALFNALVAYLCAITVYRDSGSTMTTNLGVLYALLCFTMTLRAIMFLVRTIGSLSDDCRVCGRKGA